MSTLEYEVLFIRDSVNVMALAFVDEGDFSDDETLEQVAVRRALTTVNEVLCTSFDVEDFDEITTKHTGTLA